MKVTAKQLRAKDACPDQVLIFEKEWPNGVEISQEVLQRAVEVHLDLDWFAFTFLPAPAREAYKKAIAPAWAAYIKATATAWAAYDKATAREAYKKATATAEEVLDKAIAPALYQAITEYKL